MFDSIRKHQRILQFLLLILIFPAFVFFGVSGYDRFLSDGDSVATVGGSKISRQEFDQAMRRQLEQMRRVLGDQVDAKLLDTPAARAEVLEGLIAQRVLLNSAFERKVTISDAQLRQTILAIPGLQQANGGFDKERYRALLSSQGMTEPVFESQLRRDLVIQALPEAASQSVIVPRTLVDELIRLQEQRREVRELSFKPADFATRVKPTDEQLKKYYEDNAAAYEIPESAKVEYLVLSASSIAQGITLSADDVRTYYEQNKARYGTPEERRASHILITVDAGASEDVRKAAREKAEKLLKQVRGGGDFAALAKANSQDSGSAAQGGDLGFFNRGAMVKSFADAAFGLKQGEVSGVVETEFGFHLIKLTGIKAGATRSFEDVRAEIESELKQQQAGAKFAEAADAFANMVYEQADSLKPAADRFGLKVQTMDSLARSGADLPKDSPLANQKLLTALFSAESIRTKRNTEAVEVGGNTLVSARIVEHRPSKRKPFEAVQAEVGKSVVDAQARLLAVEAGSKRLEELRGGASDSGFSEARTISRVEATNVPTAAVDAVFKTPASKLPVYVGVDLGARGYSVYQLVKVTDPSAELVAQRRAGYERQLAQAFGQQQTADLVEAMKARAKITRRVENTTQKGDAP